MPSFRTGVAAVLALALIAAAASPARAQPAPYDGAGDADADCLDYRDPAVAIRGCTYLIETDTASVEDRAWAYYQRSQAYDRTGRKQAAITDALEAIAIEPLTGLYHLHLGLLRVIRGQNTLADIHFENAVRFSDPRLIAGMKLMMSYWKCGIGEADAARRFYAEAMAVEKPDFDTDQSQKGLQAYLARSFGYKGPTDGSDSPEFQAALGEFFQSGCAEHFVEYFRTRAPERPASPSVPKP